MPHPQAAGQTRRGSAGSAGVDAEKSREQAADMTDNAKRSQSPGKTERMGASPRRYDQRSESPRGFVKRSDSPRGNIRRSDSPRGAAQRCESLGRHERSRNSSTDREEFGSGRRTISEFLSGCGGKKRQSETRSSSLGRRDGNEYGRSLQENRFPERDRNFLDERNCRKNRAVFYDPMYDENRCNSRRYPYDDHREYFIRRPASQDRCAGYRIGYARSHREGPEMHEEPGHRDGYYGIDRAHRRQRQDDMPRRRGGDAIMSDGYRRSFREGGRDLKEHEYAKGNDDHIYRFNRYGFDKYGYDPFGFDKYGIDRFGNYRASTHDPSERY